MERKQLADEIRGAGLMFRFADGPVSGILTGRGAGQRVESPDIKAGLSDWKIIRLASTCSECDAVASKCDTELVEQMAENYEGFARLIWPCIKHEPWCGAEPYISVSEKATDILALAREAFEAKRKAEKIQKAAKLLRGKKAIPEEKKQQEKEAEKVAKKIASLEAALDAARKALREHGRRVTKKAARKKPTTTKKKVAKKKKS